MCPQTTVDITRHPDHLDSTTTVQKMSEINTPRTSTDRQRWSYHFHLSLVNGQKVSAFVTFSRTYLEPATPSTSVHVDQLPSSVGDPLVHSHVVNFAISVPANNVKASSDAAPKGQYHFTTALDSNHLDHLRCSVEAESRMDPFIRHSLLDMLSDARVPAPDSLIPGDVSISTVGPLSLKYGNLASVECLSASNGDDAYHVVAHGEDGSYGFELRLIPRKPPVQYEMKGLPRRDSVIFDNGTYHSFVSHCEVSGVVRLDHSEIAVDSSQSMGWYEQDSGGSARKEEKKTTTSTESSWTWASLQLSNSWNLKIHTIWDVDIHDGGSLLRDRKAILISPEGASIACDTFDLEEVDSWSSMITLNDYGTKWKLTVPQLELCVVIEASFSQQEFGTICAGRGYWKGRVSVTGKMGVDQVNGLGIVENRPAQFITNLETHLKRAARLTTLEVSKIYPDRLINAEHAMKALGYNSPDYIDSDPMASDPLRFMKDVSLDVLYQHVFAPVRHLINGTGKSWRSYLSMLSIAVLGADPEPFRPLLAAVELAHTGTLIIDDIQDESPLRRGVPAVHTVWGVASAINAGESAYFAFDTAVQSMTELSPEKKLGLLQIFFETMRFAHAGQALDIAGQQQSLLDDILAGRVDPSALEKSILSIHRLKTAIVASNITKMSALLAGASPAQTRALAAHWERVGIAFQIIDDVYDIRRGSHTQSQKENQRMANQQPLKRRGDDIRSGKISIPIAKAGQMMPLDEARWIWNTVLSKPGDDDITTQNVIDKLEACGVVDKCIAEAQDMINESWPNLEGHLTDSQAKVYIHALCRYMGEYHSI